MDVSFLGVVMIALRSWGLLALGLGILFVVLLVLNGLTNKNKDQDK